MIGYISSICRACLLAVTCWAMVGCQPGVAPSNRAMADRLQQLAEEADPLKNSYLSRGRVTAMRSQPVPEQPIQQISHQIRLAKESLQAGLSQEAADRLSELVQLAPRYGIRTNPSLRNMLALAYLRLGEQQNCIEGHNIESCLLPISRAGVYQRPEGSRRAAAIYEAMVESDPTDLESRWLLNIAHMTLGQYPDGVPAGALIPPASFVSKQSVGHFQDRAMATGVGVVGLAGGAVVEDFTGDGLLDIAASSWDLQGPLRFFRNAGDGRFEDATQEAGLTGLYGGLNVRQVDYNNDGRFDLFVLRGAWFGEQGLHPNSLLRNEGDGTFVDVTEEAGLLSLHPTQTAAWADFNNDGWVDVFIGNESARGKETPFLGDEAGKNGQHPCELYLNRGDGTFVDVARRANADVVGFVKGVSWGDIDNDGFMDIYISRLRASNMLLKNMGPDEGGVPRFVDVTESAGVGEPIYSFPTWFWDFDNDGFEDIFVAGYRAESGDIAAEYLGLPHGAERPRLYRNNGDGTFQDVAAQRGLDKILYAMGCNFGDLDNDGWLDFYVGTGDPNFRLLIPNRMFRNDAGRFVEVSTSGGFAHLQKGHGVGFGDVDNDGDQDIYAVMGGAYAGDQAANVLFENPGQDNHWIKLELLGVESNRRAVGARVQLQLGERSVYSRVGPGASFGANPYRRELGLGSAQWIDQLRVRWPSGREQVFTQVEGDRVYRLEEGGQLQRLEWPTIQLAAGHAGH